jgi:hypothetical protein
MMIALACVVALIAGCSGDDGSAGLQGPQGPAGTPQPIKVLIAGAENDVTLQARVVAMTSEDLFPIGTQISYLDVTAAAPTLATLRQYDAVLAYSQ